MNNVATDILVVGGGPAGMAAAIAASKNRDVGVAIVDDNPRLGGQIWRAEIGQTGSADAAKLISAIDERRIALVNNAQIFAAPGSNRLAAATPSGRVEFEYKKLILATGARERFLPFPGWTMPGVFGAGGLQALAKGGLNVENTRVVVAGTGPLLLAVADYLTSKGARVPAIIEQTQAFKIRRFARGLWRVPSKLVEAAAMRARLMGVPYWTDSWVTSVGEALGVNSRIPMHRDKGSTLQALTVTLFKNRKTLTLECDYLACGFHLVPNVEVATLVGCKITGGLVAVDEFQQTSCENVFCAGEPTGIGGVEASLVEGKIAGHAAVGNENEARRLLSERASTRRFAETLNSTFELRDELRSLPDDGTIVCRCEDVVFGRLGQLSSQREAKLQTRCGMGACQGRVCGAANEFLFGWQPDTVRPPLFPVKMENL